MKELESQGWPTLEMKALAEKSSLHIAVQITDEQREDEGEMKASSCGLTPLCAAATSGAVEIAECLLGGRADPTALCGAEQSTALHASVAAGCLPMVKLLLRHLSPAKADAETASGDRALHFALALLREGAGRWAEGPSQRAEVEGCAAWAIVEELLRHGFCLEVENCERITPLASMVVKPSLRVVANAIRALRARVQQMPHH